MSKKRRFLLGLALAVSIGIIFSVAFRFSLLHSLQSQSNDFFFQSAALLPRTEPDGTITIVGIDDKSLTRLGRISSWSRSLYAQVIDRLTQAEARVIVFDVLLSEPAPGDEILAKSLQNAGNVILPQVLSPGMPGPGTAPASASASDFVRPLETFTRDATAIGHAHIIPDSDGIVRKLAVVLRDGDTNQPALALAAAAKYLRRPEVIESPATDDALLFAGRSIPLSENREMRINYIDRPQGTGRIVNFTVISFADVLNGAVSPSAFHDRIVLIGSVASGLGDVFMTPAGQMMNGVEIHASAIHTILSAHFLTTPPDALTILIIIAIAALCGFFVLRLRVLLATLSSALLLVVYFFIAFSWFDHGTMLNLLYPPLTLAGTFVGINLFNVAVERTEKRKITETFGRYLSPSVVERVMATLAKGCLKLGGEEHEVTIAFADVRGFTAISEKAPPADLVKALNAYLSLVIKAVIDHDGIINKFGGDSVMAVWNAPLPREGHALLAIRAALAAQDAIEKLSRQGHSMPAMRFGIGINTGRALAGNMGSADRMEYTVIGDVVNIAARLADGATAGKIWIGEGTLAQIKDKVTVQALAPLPVKGKAEAVPAYEVVRLRPVAEEAFIKNNQ